MARITAFSRNYAVAAFIALTILLTFGSYLLPLPREVVPFIMVLVPTVVAFVLAAVTEGSQGIRALLGKLTQWRFGLKWLAIALALALIMRLAMSLLALLLGYISTIALRQATVVELVALFVMFFVAAMLEEIGWRGFALPKLLENHSPLYAALLIGAFWGFLHLALHLPGMPNEGLAGALTVLQLIGLSVLITWIFIHGRYNLILAGIFHAAQTFFAIFNEGVTLEQGHVLMAAVWCAAALIVVVADKSMLGADRRKTALSPQ